MLVEQGLVRLLKKFLEHDSLEVNCHGSSLQQRAREGDSELKQPPMPGFRLQVSGLVWMDLGSCVIGFRVFPSPKALTINPAVCKP